MNYYKLLNVLLVIIFLFCIYCIKSVAEPFKSVKDWRVDIKRGDILYDPNGWELDIFNVLEKLPWFEPILTGHIGIYVGDIVSGDIVWPRQVVEASFVGGEVYNIGVETWDYPNVKEAWILRPKATTEQINKALSFIFKQVGKKYSIDYRSSQVNSDVNNESWYCSELVWAAYKSAGVELIDFGRQEGKILDVYVSPHDIFADNDVNGVGYHGEISPIPNDAYRAHNKTLSRSYFSISEALADARPNNKIEITEGGYLELLEIKTSGMQLTALNKSRQGIAETVVRSVEKKGVLNKKLGEFMASYFGSTWDPRESSIIISTPQVMVDGITFTGAWGGENLNDIEDWSQVNAGVKINSEANNCTISNCIIFNNPFGIAVRDSSQHNFSQNFITYNTHGIAMLRVYDTEIYRNEIENSFERGIVAIEKEEDCATLSVIKDSQDTQGEEVAVEIRSLRDNKLPSSFVEDYYRYSSEILRVINNNSNLKEEAVSLYSKLKPFVLDNDLKFSLEKKEELVSFLENLKFEVKKEEAKVFLDKSLLIAQETAGLSLNEVIEISFLDEKKINPSAVAKRPVYVFLNFFKNNSKSSTHKYSDGLFFWYSRRVLKYKYKEEWYTSFLGNRLMGRDGSDNDLNGVIDVSNYGDKYPLVSHPDEYLLEGEQEETKIHNWTLY